MERYKVWEPDRSTEEEAYAFKAARRDIAAEIYAQRRCQRDPDCYAQFADEVLVHVLQEGDSGPVKFKVHIDPHPVFIAKRA